MIFSAEAGQNQNERPSYSHGEIVGIGGCSLGAGAIPALSSNRDTPPFCPCCLSCLGSTGRVCGVPSATVCVGQSIGRTEAPTPMTGCESLALHQFLTGEEKLVWNDYYELQTQVTRLECTNFDSPRLPLLRTMLAAHIPIVDALLEKAAGLRALHIHPC